MNLFELSIVKTNNFDFFIDFYFDKSNAYLNEANKEIDQIPSKITKYKDWIIFFLLYIICLLLVMILVKTYMHRHLYTKI